MNHAAFLIITHMEPGVASSRQRMCVLLGKDGSTRLVTGKEKERLKIKDLDSTDVKSSIKTLHNNYKESATQLQGGLLEQMAAHPAARPGIAMATVAIASKKGVDPEEVPASPHLPPPSSQRTDRTDREEISQKL